MQLSPRQRSFLVNEQVLGAFVVNFVLNALGGWLGFRHFVPVPMWTFPGVVLDVLGGLGPLAFIITLITTPVVRAALRKKKLEPLAHGPEAYRFLRMLPRHNLWRAIWFGFAIPFAFDPLISLAVYATGLDQLELWPFLMFKGTVYGLAAAVVSPIAALYTLAQASESAPAVELEPALASDQAYSPASQA